MIKIKLFLTFLKIGLLGFGGGYAMIALARTELVERRRWLTVDEFSDFFALSQAFPGIISVNFTAFVGQKIGGFSGLFLAVLGMIFPAFISILLLATLIQEVESCSILKHALAGVRIAVAVMVLQVAVGQMRTSVQNRLGYAILGLTFLWLLFHLSPVVPLLLSGLFGWIYYKRKNKVFK